jgi:hypothetical protein
LRAQRALDFAKDLYRAAVVSREGRLRPFPRETNPLLGTRSIFQSQNTPFKPTYEICGLEAALRQLRQLPPLVSSWEVECLKEQLAEAALGTRFLLQGGDCSKTFADRESGVIANKLKILLQMSLVLVQGARQRVIRAAGLAANTPNRDLPTRKRARASLCRVIAAIW